MNNEYLCQAVKLSKSFGATKALVDVDFAVKPGEIHGLIGENGSGKSTMSSIFAGIQKADSGKLYVDGKEYTPSGTIDAMNKGVSMVVQEQGTIGKISVAANIFFGKPFNLITNYLELTSKEEADNFLTYFLGDNAVYTPEEIKEKMIKFYNPELNEDSFKAIVNEFSVADVAARHEGMEG